MSETCARRGRCTRGRARRQLYARGRLAVTVVVRLYSWPGSGHCGGRASARRGALVMLGISSILAVAVVVVAGLGHRSGHG